MNDKVQSNREEIIEIHGELKLINHEIKNIKENHLSHLDYKISFANQASGSKEARITGASLIY